MTFFFIKKGTYAEKIAHDVVAISFADWNICI